MDHNSEEIFSPTILLSPFAEQLYLPLADLINVPGHDDGIQRFQGHNMLQIEPTGHNTEQGSGSGSGPLWEIEDIKISELGSGLLCGNEAPVGDIRIGEQGSGSGSGAGLPQANIVEAEATAAVPGRPGQKRNGEINSAERSKNSRAKKKKEEHDMKEKMQWLEEKNKRLQKKIKKLKKNQNESKVKQNVQLRKMRQSNARIARSKKAFDELQIQANSLSQTLENISYLQEENTRLKADKDLLMQQGNAGTNAKKWVKIPLGDRILKIEGNVLFLKMA